MNFNNLNRALLAVFIGTVCVGFSTSALAQAQPKGLERQIEKDKKDKQRMNSLLCVCMTQIKYQ